MAKGSGTTRMKRPAQSKNGGGNITVEQGFPSGYVDVIKQQLDALNKEFGFYPDIECVNKKNIEYSAVGKFYENDFKIKLGNGNPERIVGDGHVVDHEYGHIFDVRIEPSLKDVKAMVKLNPGNEYFKKKLAQKQQELKEYKASPLFPKWKRLNEIFQEVKREVPKALQEGVYRYTNLSEFAAEVFAGHRAGIKYPFNQKKYDEAYKIIISLPPRNKKK